MSSVRTEVDREIIFERNSSETNSCVATMAPWWCSARLWVALSLAVFVDQGKTSDVIGATRPAGWLKTVDDLGEARDAPVIKLIIVNSTSTTMLTTWDLPSEGKMNHCYIRTEPETGSNPYDCMSSITTAPDNGKVTYYFTVTGLQNCTEYKLQIGMAIDASTYVWGEDEDTTTSDDCSCSPEMVAPRNLRCNMTESGELQLKWDIPLESCKEQTKNYSINWLAQSKWSSTTASNTDITELEEYLLPAEEIMAYSEYEFEVRANYVDGLISVPASTNYVTPQQESSAPRNVSVDQETAFTLSVSWEPPEQANGLLTGYQVLVQLDVVAPANNWTYSVEGLNDTSVIIDSNLEQCTGYLLSVAAVNGAGPGQLNAPVPGETTYDDEENPLIEVTCSQSESSISVAWPDVLTMCQPSNYTLEYNITVLWTDEVSTPPEQELERGLSFVVPEEDYHPGTEYWFHVSTDTKAGACSLVSEDERSNAPNLTIEVKNVTEISLSWVPPTEANGVITGYLLTWGDGTSDPLEDEVDASATSWVIEDDVVGCTGYTVTLRAVNGAGPGSAASEEVTTGIQGPSRPLECYPTSPYSLSVSFVPPSDSCAPNGTLIHCNGSALWDAALEDTNCSQVVQGSNVSLSGLLPYSQYTVCFTLPEEELLPDAPCCQPVTDQDVPTRPLSFEAEPPTDTAICLSWAKPDQWRGEPVGYLLIVSKNELELGLHQTETCLKELVPGTTYKIELQACSQAGCGDPAQLTRTTTGGGGGENGGSNNTGAIVGGVLGGVAALAALALGVVLFFRRQRDRQSDWDDDQPQDLDTYSEDSNSLSSADSYSHYTYTSRF